MTERDEMIERAKPYAKSYPGRASLRTFSELMTDFAASEVARERERIAVMLDEAVEPYWGKTALVDDVLEVIDRLRSKV